MGQACTDSVNQLITIKSIRPPQTVFFFAGQKISHFATANYLGVRFILKNRDYVYEENEHFYVTYNASIGLLKLILGIGFSVLMLWLAQTAFVGSIVMPLTIFFGFTLTIFVVSIPYSISNIRKDNKGIIWAGSKEGLYLGGEVSQRFLHEWSGILKVTIVDHIEYERDDFDGPSLVKEKNVLLFELKSLKNPITGNHSKYMLGFDRKKHGMHVMKFNYPKGFKERVIKLLKKYSSGELVIDSQIYVRYEFRR